MSPTDQEIAAHLVAAGIAGPHRSHPREDNIRKAGQLASGDPDATFGIAEVASASTQDALKAVMSLTGAREPAEPWIDPAATIAGVRRAAAALRPVCTGRGTVLLATGHPQGLLGFHALLAAAIAGAGATVIRPLDGAPLRSGGVLRYTAGSAALTDGGRVRHTHSPAPMEEILASGATPDLVLADHGFAGAAIARGIPTVAVMDTNDPALAVAHARGREVTVIPMDDNRRPDSYDVLAGLFARELDSKG